MTDRLSNADLRRLFLERPGLADSPGGPLTRDRLDALVERLGFVPVATISTLQQAHHHILFTRAAGYRKSLLNHLLEERPSRFAPWTHYASIIPTRFYPYWKPRFVRAAARLDANLHWAERFHGRREAFLGDIRRRLADVGPLRKRDVTPDAAEQRGTSGAGSTSTPALGSPVHPCASSVTHTH